MILASLFLSVITTAENTTIHVAVEEANAYLPIVTEYLGIVVLEYATILDMDGNGT